MYFEGQAMGQLSTLQRAKEHHGNKQQELQGSLKRQKHFKICEQRLEQSTPTHLLTSSA